MTGASSQELGVLPKLVIAVAISLIAAGVLWHGVKLEASRRLWNNLVDRPSGPMAFRFILQPAMAGIAASRSGVKDARTGRSPYFWSVLRRSQECVARLREGLNAAARVIFLGLVMDVIYQIIELKMFYPVEALIIALLLAFFPYLLIRGPAARIARRWRAHEPGGEIR
jgi:hypothetical protein